MERQSDNLTFFVFTKMTNFKTNQILWANGLVILCYTSMHQRLWHVYKSGCELQLDHVGCNLLWAIWQSKLQYSQQYVHYCNIQGEQNIRFDCKYFRKYLEKTNKNFNIIAKSNNPINFFIVNFILLFKARFPSLLSILLPNLQIYLKSHFSSWKTTGPIFYCSIICA